MRPPNRCQSRSQSVEGVILGDAGSEEVENEEGWAEQSCHWLRRMPRQLL